MDDSPHLVPVPSPLLGVGQFSRVLLVYSCQAPKPSAFANGNPEFKSRAPTVRIYFNEAVGFRQRKSGVEASMAALSDTSMRPSAFANGNVADSVNTVQKMAQLQ